MQILHDRQLDLLGDVDVTIVVVDSLVAFSLAAAVDEEHDVLEVLLVD